jgi:hypothetical protein
LRPRWTRRDRRRCGWIRSGSRTSTAPGRARRCGVPRRRPSWPPCRSRTCRRRSSASLISS